MLKIQSKLKKKPLNRRDFLSRTTAIGGMALLGFSTSPVQAIKATSTTSDPTMGDSYKSVHPANATVNDFAELVGKRFRLQTEDGTTVRVRLIETHTPPTRRAPRFRREHFSIVFDVPGSLKLDQGQYHLSHPQIGSMELFMVPVDLPADHNRLEAIFA